MRVVSISVQGDKIIKQYELSPAQQQGIQQYLPEYVSWIDQIGFKTPDTELSLDGQTLIFLQAYIQGFHPGIHNWIAIIDLILRQPEQMPYGLDANPLNFIFNERGIYFIDFYPLLVSSNHAFLASQFSYDRKLILTRYFNKWNVLVCFLNRLKKNDEAAFNACFGYIGNEIIQHLSDVGGRDTLRLVEATRCDRRSFDNYYAASRQAERTLSHSKLEVIAKELKTYLNRIRPSFDARDL